MASLVYYVISMVVISAGLAWLERRYPYATKSQMPRSRAVSAMYKRVPFYNVAAISILWYLLNFTGFSKGGFIPIGSLIHESSPASAVLTVLLLWLIYTGVDGTLHYLRHRSDLLWNIHKTHHSDTAMDLSTTVFRSEAEIAFNLVAFMVLFGVVISAPWWAILAAFGIESAMQLLHHANFRPAPWLLSTAGRVVQFPPHHRIHHSRTHQGYFWTFQPYNYLYELVNANAMPAIENAHNYQTGFEESADPRPGFDERRRADSAHSGRVDTGK